MRIIVPMPNPIRHLFLSFTVLFMGESPSLASGAEWTNADLEEAFVDEKQTYQDALAEKDIPRAREAAINAATIALRLARSDESADFVRAASSLGIQSPQVAARLTELKAALAERRLEPETAAGLRQHAHELFVKAGDLKRLWLVRATT